MTDPVQTIFKEFVEKKPKLFKDRKALTSHFTPKTIPHREKQINNLASILAPSLKGERPSNVFMYGMTGTGKCVIGSTPIYLTNPGPLPIELIVEKFSGELIEEGPDHSIYLPSDTLNLFGIGDDLKMRKDKVIHLYKQKSPQKLVKLKTTSGREIITSLKHAFLTLENSTLNFKNSENLNRGEFIAIPRRLPVEGGLTDLSIPKHVFKENKGLLLVDNARKAIKKIDVIDESIAKFLGIMIAEGLCRHYKHYISITNKNPLILKKVKHVFDRFGLEYRERDSRKCSGLAEIIASSKTFYYFLGHVLGYPVDKLSHEKEIPKVIFSSPLQIQAAFLQGLIECDGYISSQRPEIEYSTSSPVLADHVLCLLLNFGIVGRLKTKKTGRDHFRITISGKQFLKKFKERINFISNKKTIRLEKHLRKKGNTNVDVIPNIGKTLKEIREKTKMFAREMGKHKSTIYYYEANRRFPSRERLREFLVQFKRRINRIRYLYLMCKQDNNFLLKLFKTLKLELKEIAQKTNVSPAMLSYFKRRNREKFKSILVKIKNSILDKAKDIFNDEELRKKISFLETLVNSDIFWDQIKTIEILEDHNYEYIYDVETERTHTFVGGNGGLISHNTLVSKYVGSELQKTPTQNKDQVKVIYINCKMKKTADTEYRLVAELARRLGQEVPVTGLPTEHVYQIFFNALDSKEWVAIIILDEIDSLVEKIGDDFLYNFTRINEDLKKAKVSVIGITNDLHFIDILDPRVKSSLGEEEILFPPYNAPELQDILEQRVEVGLLPGVLSEEVIPKCAALAAQEHGDARRALDLLRVAGEIAERREDTKITGKHLNLALEKIDYDRVIESTKSLPKQTKLVLYSIIGLEEKEQKDIQTGDVYNVYEETCKECGLHILTQRRVSDLISELDMIGIINAKVVSLGRYGRTREIKLNVSKKVRNKMKDILKSNLML